MYRMNLAASLFKKSMANSVVVKILQILNIIFQISIVLLLLISFVLSTLSKKYEREGYILKKSVFEMRRDKNIDETLKIWNDDYSRLFVINNQILKSSRYGVAMKELGNFLPKDDLIHAVAFEKSSMEMILKVNKNNIFKKDGTVDYHALLQKLFENSLCFDKDKIKVELISKTKNNEFELIQQGVIKNKAQKLKNDSTVKEIKLFNNKIDLPNNPSIQLLKVTMNLNERKN